MKKFILCLAAGLLGGAAFSTPISDLTAGADLAAKCVGGTYSVTVSVVNYSASGSLVPSGVVPTIVHIPKPAAGLVASLPMSTVFPILGLSTNLTFSGAADATTNGIAWTVSDPSAIGTTINIKFGANTYPTTINSVSGTVYTDSNALGVPVLDPFDHNYRGTGFTNDASHTSTVTITGVALGWAVNITFHPQMAGIGGVPGQQFVLSTTIAGNAVNLVTGQTYNATVNLELPAVQDTVVNFSSNELGAIAPVTVLKGTSSAPFSFTVNLVYGNLPVWLTASSGGHTFTKSLNALPLLASVAAVTTPTIAGAPVEFAVTLNANAPTGGFLVYLHSDDPNLIVPASVTVLAGAKTVNFTATPAVVSTDTTITGITGTYIEATHGGTVVRSLVTLH
jgi:hypothetical protein